MEAPSVSGVGCCNLSLIPFVTPSIAEKTAKHISSFELSLENGLSGEEAANFYNSVISTPSANQSVSSKLRGNVNQNKKKLTPSSKPDCKLKLRTHSIFRHAQEGKLKEVQQYIFDGFSVDQQDAHGWTPVMCATCEGHVTIVEYLIQCGANLNIKCKYGMTAVDIAKKCNNKTIEKLLQSTKVPVTTSSSTANQIKEEKEKYCETCKIFYMSSLIIHKRSIAHLLSDKKQELSTLYHIPESNKGFQIMLRSGWDKNKGLGPNANGRKFPIKTVLKKDRACIGKNKEIPKVTHFLANDDLSVETKKDKPVKIVREKTVKKWKRIKMEKIDRQREINFRREFY